MAFASLDRFGRAACGGPALVCGGEAATEPVRDGPRRPFPSCFFFPLGPTPFLTLTVADGVVIQNRGEF